jgi:hypothetical protein
MGEMRDFVADMLEAEGAVVEPVEPDGLEVLAPEPVRNSMGWPELVRLGFGAQLPPGATHVGLEGDWLDRFGVLLGERGRWAERQLVLAAPQAPPADPDGLLERALDLPNAVWRSRGVAAAWARCLLLAFRYTAVSDEKREGLVWLGFNQSTGAAIDAALPRLRLLMAQDAEWRTPEPDIGRTAGPAWDAAMREARIRPLLDHHVRRELGPFLRAMRRRLSRDHSRVHDYHEDLRLACLRKLSALAGAAGDKARTDRERETLRVEAIEREYAAKVDDLRHNYATRVMVEWVQGLELIVPVHRYEALIKRRKGERIIRLDWHPAIRLAEPPPSDWGLGLERTRLVCDDRLHLTDPAGQAPCPSCGKAWCRACAPAACPRCGWTTPVPEESMHEHVFRWACGRGN